MDKTKINRSVEFAEALNKKKQEDEARVLKIIEGSEYYNYLLNYLAEVRPYLTDPDPLVRTFYNVFLRRFIYYIEVVPGISISLTETKKDTIFMLDALDTILRTNHGKYKAHLIFTNPVSRIMFVKIIKTVGFKKDTSIVNKEIFILQFFYEKFKDDKEKWEQFIEKVRGWAEYFPSLEVMKKITTMEEFYSKWESKMLESKEGYLIPRHGLLENLYIDSRKILNIITNFETYVEDDEDENPELVVEKYFKNDPYFSSESGIAHKFRQNSKEDKPIDVMTSEEMYEEFTKQFALSKEDLDEILENAMKAFEKDHPHLVKTKNFNVIPVSTSASTPTSASAPIRSAPAPATNGNLETNFLKPLASLFENKDPTNPLGFLSRLPEITQLVTKQAQEQARMALAQQQKSAPPPPIIRRPETKTFKEKMKEMDDMEKMPLPKEVTDSVPKKRGRPKKIEKEAMNEEDDSDETTSTITTPVVETKKRGRPRKVPVNL